MSSQVYRIALKTAALQVIAVSLVSLVALASLGILSDAGASALAVPGEGYMALGAAREMPFALRIGLADILVASGLIATLGVRLTDAAEEIRQRAGEQAPEAPGLVINELLAFAALATFCSFLMVFHKPPELLTALFAQMEPAAAPSLVVLLGWDALFSVAFVFFGVITRAALISKRRADV